jgi:hypothetical protein
MKLSLFLIADAIVHATAAASVCFSADGVEKVTKEECDEIARYVAGRTMVSSRENLLLLLEKSLKT